MVEFKLNFDAAKKEDVLNMEEIILEGGWRMLKGENLMKKFLVLILVLGMASLANATVIDVLVDGSLPNDPLLDNDTVGLKIVLNYNPYAGYSSYDGYALSSMNLALHADGDSSLAAGPAGKVTGLIFSDDFDTTSYITDNIGGDPGFSAIGGVAAPPVKGDGDPTTLVSNIILTAKADDSQEIVINLAIGTSGTQYAPYTDWSGADPWPATPGWLTAVEADLGDLTLNVVPEPITMALLGLGGVVLLRRRRT